jgi:hypothetical protein
MWEVADFAVMTKWKGLFVKLQMQEPVFYNSGILKLMSRWDECIYRLENCADI